MKIHKMTASFGMLENDTLELSDGLNIVYAPNESGKSTWCAFIKAMLYGIESSAREKAGVKPDKIRFAPWSGAPMAGSMDIEYKDTDITLVRSGRANAPMREFSAVYTGTADPVKNLGPASAGETLLGVSKDVFERTAFIGQGKIAVSGSPELEKRIAAMVQTGEEQSSVTEAEERLKAAMRRRRWNRSGRLPEIENEMEVVRDGIRDGEEEIREGERLKKAKKEALIRRDDMLDALAEARKKTRRKTLDRMADSKKIVKKREEEYYEVSQRLDGVERQLDGSVFGREEHGKCVKRVNTDKKKLACLDKEIKQGGSVAVNLAVLIALFVADVIMVVLPYYIPATVLGAIAILQAVRLFIMNRNIKKAEDERIRILGQYKCLTVEGIENLLSEHERLSAEYKELLQMKQDAAAELAKVNRSQADQEASLLKDLDFSEGNSDAAILTKKLENAETALRNIREQSAAWEGRQSAMADPEELKERLAELTREHEGLTEEYEALTLALETLREAGEEISHRITPQLGSRTAELFSLLTASRYDAVLLDKDLKAEARPGDDSVPREASFLSTGTVDQLYLSVRLSICELALDKEKPCPVILDDALVNFDDARCKSALMLLKELAEERQMVLFTCHGREKEMMKGVPGVTVTEIK